MTPHGALAQVHAEHGLDLALEGQCPGGEVGAYYARASDGTRYVFKWFDDPVELNRLNAMVERLSRLRAKGYLLPRYLAPIRVEGGVVLIQDAVPGAWRDDVNSGLVEAVVTLNDLQAGEGRGQDTWTEYMHRTLVEGAEHYCIHETLRSHSSATRRVLGWVESVGRDLGPLPSGDVVHLDFHHRNILREGERVTAVVDWEGSQSGDRVFDLVTFCFGFTHARAEPGVEGAIWKRASELGTPDSLAAYVAHMSLRRLDWTIRHHPEELKPLAQLVERYIAQVAEP